MIRRKAERRLTNRLPPAKVEPGKKYDVVTVRLHDCLADDRWSSEVVSTTSGENCPRSKVQRG